MLNDMNTLVHYIDANEMKSQRIKGLTASDLDHLCQFFFMKIRWKNGEEKASQQQYFRFSAMLKREEKFIQPS